MEKTKKLLAYVVVFAAVLTLLFAGVTIQANGALAAGSPEISIETVYGLDGVELTAGSVKITVPVERQEQENLKQEKKEIEKGQISLTAKSQLNEIAKSYDADADYESMVYSDPLIVTLTGSAASGAKVTFDLSGYAAPVDFVLFKKNGNTNWEVVLPETAAAGAANAAGANDSITVRLTGSGSVMFGGFSQAKADEIKAAKPSKDGTKCDCCSDNCPFCYYLCKDGKCYCWTMYVVIALAVVFIILIIVLVVVKSKAKKKAAAKEEEEIVAAEEKKEEEVKPEE